MNAHDWQPRWDRLLAVNPNYRAIWRNDPAAWAASLDVTLWNLFPEARGEIPSPVPPEAATDWIELVQRSERCEFRQAVKEDGCCGPRYRCVGGRRAGQLAEPISVCVGCMRDLDAADAGL
jgi:hypothetical protein